MFSPIALLLTSQNSAMISLDIGTIRVTLNLKSSKVLLAYQISTIRTLVFVLKLEEENKCQSQETDGLLTEVYPGTAFLLPLPPIGC